MENEARESSKLPATEVNPEAAASQPVRQVQADDSSGIIAARRTAARRRSAPRGGLVLSRSSPAWRRQRREGTLRAFGTGESKTKTMRMRPSGCENENCSVKSLALGSRLAHAEKIIDVQKKTFGGPRADVGATTAQRQSTSEPFAEFAASVGMKRACEALGVSEKARRTRCVHAYLDTVHDQRPRPAPASRPSSASRCWTCLLGAIHRRRTPTTVCARLLNEDQQYHCHPRSCTAACVSKKPLASDASNVSIRRTEKPELIATGPDHVYVLGRHLAARPRQVPLLPAVRHHRPLQPLQSRSMLAHETTSPRNRITTSARAKASTPTPCRVHADRGPVPKGQTVKQTLLDLDVGLSLSGPRVSNSRPILRGRVPHLKYGPTVPITSTATSTRAVSVGDVPWYNDRHRRSPRIAYFTPPMSTTGASPALLAKRRRHGRGVHSSARRFPRRSTHVSPDRPPPSGYEPHREPRQSSSDCTKPADPGVVR